MCDCYTTTDYKKAPKCPTFWYPESGWTVLEYVEWSIENRDWKRFDPRLHRNQGYKGSGSCKVENCKICALMQKHGV